MQVHERSQKKLRQTILIVLAHPDDESFPIGGTIAKYADRGHRIILVSATKGEAGIPGISAVEAAAVRQAEMMRAAGVLGIEQVIFLGYQDGEVTNAPAGELSERLVRLIRKYQPDVVITFGPDGISGHPDHIAVWQAVSQAVPSAGVMTRLFYIAPSEATAQGCGVPPVSAVQQGVVASIDVGRYLVTKVKAMQAHQSQQPPFSGDPEVEAQKLVCHEYFTLAHPLTPDGTSEDLFESQYLERIKSTWAKNTTTTTMALSAND